MTEAMPNPFRRLDSPAAGGAPARAANGAALRWTPGPDELRLPDCEDEHVPQNTVHAVATVDCFDGLRLHWRGRPDVFVGFDQFVYWDPAYHSRTNPDNPPVAPDVYVAFGVANRHRRSYVVWEEGKPPDFVLEVASPSGRGQDARKKPPTYAKMGVPEFFLYDPNRQPVPELSGFELRGGAYRALPEERIAGGVAGVRSKALGLYLCLKPSGFEPLDGSLRWYDPAAGEFLPTRHELADDKRRLAADKRDAEARAAASEARVAELTAQIERIRRG